MFPLNNLIGLKQHTGNCLKESNSEYLQVCSDRAGKKTM